MGCWLAVFILLETGRVYALREDGVCTFGWEWWALIPLMGLDVFVNFYLLAMFVVPLMRNQFSNRRLRSLAIKSMWTALGSVIATISNLVMLIMIEAPGWLCLTSCGIDIFANAALLYYMTRTLKRDNKEAKATWTVAQYNAPETETPYSDAKCDESSRYTARHGDSDSDGDKDSPTVVQTISAFESDNKCDVERGGIVLTTICKGKGQRSETSIPDDDSQRAILPSAHNTIYVSHEVEYLSMPKKHRASFV
ncbi:hypothetical protein HBH98_195220 [Parastagonospora nodorum]|nr:hypothetical protein HBH52_213630 [Parastagonospora nodorum]KAH4060110.1 hypothetical protein HBH50_226880 [Parastagonospora nodorum]KAH4077906.1 hypothetical protein HBH48_235720 [Parastagonospora nodorum]KAH4083980.1 hypothetical protein HBH46_215190 [Parastagonospora nodorum]KAH4153779.1 hypothetical protein HBH43_223870 [Parastagonospora nodorum]